MTTHAAEPGCQILWLVASLAFQDSLPTDQYQGPPCEEPVRYRVQVEREETGRFLRLDANVCAPHHEIARHAQGFKGSYVRQAVTT